MPLACENLTPTLTPRWGYISKNKYNQMSWAELVLQVLWWDVLMVVQVIELLVPSCILVSDTGGMVGRFAT